MSILDIREIAFSDCVISAEEIAQLEREIYTEEQVSLETAVVMCEINDAVMGNPNDASWDDFFMRVLSDALTVFDGQPEEKIKFLVEHATVDLEKDSHYASYVMDHLK